MLAIIITGASGGLNSTLPSNILDESYWRDQLKQLNITSKDQIQYLTQGEKEQLLAKKRHDWEANALNQLFQHFSSINVNLQSSNETDMSRIRSYLDDESMQECDPKVTFDRLLRVLDLTHYFSGKISLQEVLTITDKPHG